MPRAALLILVPLFVFSGQWTTLVYMAADNDLAECADSDLVEMQAIGSSADNMIVVQIDKPNIGARRLFINQGGVSELQNLGIIDMCDWQTLSEFLQWGILNFPADKYCVILWDHGTGWTMMPHKSFGYDWSGGSQLSIANGDFQKALSTAYEGTGTVIDVFAFDACLMQQVEVACELLTYARILVGPQTICPVQGFRYDRIFDEISQDPGMNETELAQTIVEINVEHYTPIQPMAYSAVRLDRLNELKTSLNRLCTTLMTIPPDVDIIELRETVQTIPLIGYYPVPSDEYVDLGDYINGLHVILGSEAENLQATYTGMIVAAAHGGDIFSKTTGLTVWFPHPEDYYNVFKRFSDSYAGLDWVQSRWQEFLNWFYGMDDVRPRPVTITAGAVGDNNDVRLFWHEAYDLAPVTYSVIEARDTSLIFQDACEDTTLWLLDGFTLSSLNFHSGSYSFFSGNASNLSTSMEMQEPLVLENGGLASIYLYYNTQDPDDSLIIDYGSFRDIHYGISNGWQERRVFLPPGNAPFRISYHTDNAVNNGGCYIDDITIYNLNNVRFARNHCADTSLYIFNNVRGAFLYGIIPEDRYDNLGNVSNLAAVYVDEYAVPYSIPNPFQLTCDIILDYPDSLAPSIEIFSLSGRKVKVFGAVQDTVIHWDGKDENGREVGSGLYYILLKDGTFKKLGKIARQL